MNLYSTKTICKQYYVNKTSILEVQKSNRSFRDFPHSLWLEYYFWNFNIWKSVWRYIHLLLLFFLFRFKKVLVVSLIRTCMLCSIWLKTPIFHEVNFLFRNIIQNIYFCFGNLFNLKGIQSCSSYILLKI